MLKEIINVKEEEVTLNHLKAVMDLTNHNPLLIHRDFQDYAHGPTSRLIPLETLLSIDIEPYHFYVLNILTRDLREYELKFLKTICPAVWSPNK
jgi:hypothetical protein